MSASPQTAPAPPVNQRPATFAPEAELLIHCARVELDQHRAGMIRAIVAGEPHWELLLSLAVRHGMIPLVHFHLNALRTGPREAAAAARLREYALRISAMNAYLTGELRHLLAAFEARGVGAIPYKGPALAMEAYGSVSLRYFCDLDILVRKRDYAAARDILGERGFRPYQGLGLAQQSVMLRTQCNVPFTRDDDRSIVEIHWEVAARNYSRALDERGLWSRSREASFAGARVRLLAPEDLLHALCVHGSKHLWERLSWICDVAQLVGRGPQLDWDSLLDRARATGSTRLLLLGLNLADELLGATLPPNVRIEIDADARVARLTRRVLATLFAEAGPAEGMSGYFGFQLGARERLRDKLRYFGYTLGPTDEDVAQLSLPRPLSFIYYLLRPLRLLRTGGPAHLQGRGKKELPR
jgi:hypothetical protein